jgi:hypothetical protein
MTCNDDGKLLGTAGELAATGLWHDALVRNGSRFGV